MSEDLPTFERPTTAISGEGPVGNCSEPAQLLINSAFRIFTRHLAMSYGSRLRKSTKRRRSRLWLVLLMSIAIPAGALGLLWLLTLPDVSTLRTA